MRPKLNEVSERAGVSLATVSRVLNGRPGVAEATRRLVLDVVADLGYADVPIRSSHTGVVGIITPELDNPVFPLLAQSIEARLARASFLAMVCPSTSETIHEREYLEHFVGTKAAGVVVINGRYAAPEVGYADYEALQTRGLRVVLVSGITEPCPLPAVGVDLRAGAEMAVRHLHSLGHTRIGCMIGPIRYSTSQQFVEGYRRAIFELGMQTADELITETLFTVEGGRAAVPWLVEEGVTGVVAGSDLMALGAIAGARALGFEVPGDLSVVGLDGTPLVNLTDPPLTTIRQPIGRLAVSAVSLFTADRPQGVHVIRPDLVVGGSTARVRVPAAI